jgi:hypothetical protein
MTLNMFYKLLVPLLVVGITVGVLWVNPGHTVEAEVRNGREWESESEYETNAARLHYRMISNRYRQYTQKDLQTHTFVPPLLFTLNYVDSEEWRTRFETNQWQL